MSTTITINSDRSEQSYYALLTATSHSNVKGIAVGAVTKVTFPLAISWDAIDGARLYVSLSDIKSEPVPAGDAYYGWIEFSQDSAAVWINLSNVDLTALPLTLTGTETSGDAFSLGYDSGMSTIIADLEKVLTGSPPDAAKVTCTTGQTKILGPNKVPNAYRSFDNYIAALRGAEATLSITSDAPSKTQPGLTLTGKFNKTTDAYAVTLSGSNHALRIKNEYFTTQYLYQCGGGFIEWSTDGGTTYKEYAMNRLPESPPSPETTYSNSITRNIFIGMNEGYFSATELTHNVSESFAGLVPFSGGYGSQYAEVLHAHSNSYGFPYADKNLKTLIQAKIGSPLALTVIKDDEAKDYTPPPTGWNQPTSGTYQFNIGGGSSLGIISLDGWAWRYVANSGSAYGGYLPDLPDWTKMYFGDPANNQYIWIKNGAIVESSNGVNCLTGTASFANNQFTWGANIMWNSGATAPPKPTT